MTQRTITRPRCPLCRQPMHARDRGVDSRWLGPEFICLDVDCFEFGVYELGVLPPTDPSSPGGRTGVPADPAS